MKNALSTLALRVIAMLPLAAVRLLGCLLGRILYYSNTRICKITRINLKLTHPSKSAQSLSPLVRESLCNTVVTALEMPLVWQHNDQWLNNKTHTVVGEQLVREALAEQRGLLFLCPHVGNWEVFGRYVTRYAPVTSLYQPPKYRELESFVKQGREKSGATLVSTSQRGIAQLLKALCRGEITGILPDQLPKHGSGTHAPFFGVPALTMTLVHNLLKKTGCKVILGYALRDKSGFSIHFKEAPADLYDTEVSVSLTAMNKMVEMSTEEDICQYQWSYKRFRKQPDGSNPYN